MQFIQVTTWISCDIGPKPSFMFVLQSCSYFGSCFAGLHNRQKLPLEYDLPCELDSLLLEAKARCGWFFGIWIQFPSAQCSNLVCLIIEFGANRCVSQQKVTWKFKWWSVIESCSFDYWINNIWKHHCLHRHHIVNIFALWSWSKTLKHHVAPV